MERYLIIPILAFFASFIITHMIWAKRFKGNKTSKAYVGKFLWGFRYFLFPTISLFLLFRYDLSTFCISLLFWGAINICVRLVFSEEKKRKPLQKVGYLWYVFLILTLFQDNPFWMQVWPSLVWLVTLVTAILAAVLGMSDRLTQARFDTEDLSVTQIKILNWVTPCLAICLFVLNEIFRTQYTLEAWALFNAFQAPIFIFVIGLGTIIFVPIFVREDMPLPQEIKFSKGRFRKSD